MTDLAPTTEDVDRLLALAGVDQDMDYELLHAATRHHSVGAARRMATIGGLRGAYVHGCLLAGIAKARKSTSWGSLDEAVAQAVVAMLPQDVFDALAYDPAEHHACEGGCGRMVDFEDGGGYVPEAGITMCSVCS